MEHTDWENNILNSLDGMQSAHAPEFMFTRIMAKLENIREGQISSKKVYLAMACFVILCLLNFSIVKTINHHKEEGMHSHSNGYLIDNSNFNLY